MVTSGWPLHDGSAQSVNVSSSLSMPSAQSASLFSGLAHSGVPSQSKSSQSTKSSPSLSWPSSHSVSMPVLPPTLVVVDEPPIAPVPAPSPPLLPTLPVLPLPPLLSLDEDF